MEALVHKKTLILFLGIILIAFTIRIINLNYNSPFNDEAIYVVVGNMGLFKWDWWSYNAKAWMAGLPFIYPSISALAYITGGIVASRFLNVVFSILLIEEVFRFTKLLNVFDKKSNEIAGLVAMIVVAFAGIGIYVSRLATYDILSFLLLLIGVNLLIKAVYLDNGKYFLLSAVFLLFAFGTKIIVGAFFVPVIILSYIRVKDSFRYRNIWLKYFFTPMLLGGVAYVFYNIDGLFIFAGTQVLREYVSLDRLLVVIWENTKYLLMLLMPAYLLMVYKRKYILLSLLLLFATELPLIHLLTHRYSTFDKHLYLTVIFGAPIIGYGMVILGRMRSILTKPFMAIALISLFWYSINFQDDVYRLEHSWENTKLLTEYLIDNVKSGDNVLAEAGASVILAIYNETAPANVTTFDWIDYAGMQDDNGYVQAVRDSYFSYIELDGGFESKEELRDRIRNEMAGRYTLVYREGIFEVYARNN